MKRLLDIFSSLFALILLSPVFVFIGLAIVWESKGGIFYSQIRVGKNERPFRLYKFRSMRPASDASRLITVGDRDPRITKTGYFLRKYKLDELPQLLNILKGDMSVVGPRPEVPRYVQLYTPEQKKVLSVRPGLTDFASLEYLKEAELLAQAADPEKTYIDEIMPAKLTLGIKYIEQQNLWTDLGIIFATLRKIIS